MFFKSNDAVNYCQDFTNSGFVFSPFEDIENAIIFPLNESEIIEFKDEIILDETEHFQPNFNLVNREEAKQFHINLVENAVKYSDPESVIVLSMERKPEKFIINVQDTGLGIEKKHLERIFERFYRVDPARSREVGGTGLGLSIVKHIVEGHKGVISVFSRRGEGSTFSVQIPFATQTESQTHGNEIRILTSCR